MSHQVHLTGHVARIVEGESEAGNLIVSFSAASNDVRRSDTTWFRCIGHGKIAEVIKNRIKKGIRVYVRGELLSDPETGCPKVYKSASGEWRANNEVVIEYLEVL